MEDFDKMLVKFTKENKAVERAQKLRASSRYYNRNSILGNSWAIFFAVIGGRMTGKSYSFGEFLCSRSKRCGDQVKNYWLRISESSIKMLLANKASQLIDADLVRRYNLDLRVVGGRDVYNGKQHLVTVMPLSSMGKSKGLALYDKDFTGEINIILDEFQLEQGERRTSFDILYNFIGMVETIARTRKNKLRIILLGNTLEESSTILKAFNFLPEKFGRFYLKRRRCVIDNLEPTEEYLRDRFGSAASILGGDSMSNYTNSLKKDNSLIDKRRLRRPQYAIKFTKNVSDMYLVWEGEVITRYKGQPVQEVIAMRPYTDTVYNVEKARMVIERFDAQAYKFRDLITLSYFQGCLEKISRR